MEQFFKMAERGSSITQEIRSGFTTFLAMAYIIAVNPALMLAAGIPITAAVTATCIGSGVVTILMGLYANRPIALATGLGINAVVAFTLPTITGNDWHASMSIIFIEGVAILLLVLCGLREAIMNAIPISLRHSISVGLGLFIAFIGLHNGSIIVTNSATFVALNKVTDPAFIVGVVSIAATVALYSFRIKGALLCGIFISVLVGIPLGVTPLPQGVVAPLDFSSFGAPFLTDEAGVMGIVKTLTTPICLVFAFSLLMSDFFDTMGTVTAVAKPGEFLNEDGSVQNIREILTVDSAAAALGGLAGCSSITSFIEAASGAADGARTGLSAITTGVLFILAAIFAPLIAVVSSASTAGALVLVGFMMMSEAVEIDWNNVQDAFPAFCVIIGVPLTYSISNGIGFGFIAYCFIALITGKAKIIKPLMWVAAAAFVVYFVLM